MNVRNWLKINIGFRYMTWFQIRLYDTIGCLYSWAEIHEHSYDVINDRNQRPTLSSTWCKRVWSSITILNINVECLELHRYIMYLLILFIPFRFLLHIWWNARFRKWLNNLVYCYRLFFSLLWDELLMKKYNGWNISINYIYFY